MWRGIASRAPVPFLEIVRRAQRALLVLNTDNANSCKSLGNHLCGLVTQIREANPARFPNLFFLHSFCLMHQVALALNDLLAPFFLINGMFCSLCLLSNATNLILMREKLEELSKQLVISFDEDDRPTADEVKHGIAVLGFLEQGDDIGKTTHSVGFHKRAVKRLELARFLRWNKGRPTHFCGPGCKCTSQDDARLRFRTLIDELFLQRLPAAPALNKWTKLLPPICW